jgi:glyceraldehyde-3-phosphate dehydrogenase (NADP+)
MTASLPEFPTPSEIPEPARVDASPYEMRYFVDGEIRVFAGPGEPVRSPICLRAPDGTIARAVLGRMPLLGAEEALSALAAARRAWNDGRGEWPTMRVARRIGCLERFAAEMAKAREPVVRLLMWEIAKSRGDAESEFDRTLVYIRDTVDAMKQLDRDSARFAMEQGFLGQIRRAPVGVVLCMGPFNYPLNETFTTLIPALLMGNTVVSKLPKYGSLLHGALFDAFRAAFPPGVVNVIQGDGETVIGPLMASGQIDALAFIGTSRVANAIEKQHPRPNRLRTILGLESKNPAIVLPDADLAVAVPECVAGALSFNGQRCTALKLLFVHESIADRFVAELARAVDALPVGMPWQPGVKLTPLCEDGKPEALALLCEDAIAHGARVVNRGGESRATFFRPTVLYPVAPAARLYHEEQFGPVVPVVPFRHEAEIDEFMRKSPYGQQVALFGRDPRRMAGLIDCLVNQVCRINLNTQCRRGPDTFPFTGRKDSAEGTLSVSDALRAFSIRTVVALSSNDANKQLVSDILTGRMSSFLSTDFIF